MRPSITPILAAALLVVGAASAASAAIIDFENLTGGTPVTNQYQADGVLFSDDASGPAHIFFAPIEATSGTNILVGSDNFSDLRIDLVDPVTGFHAPEHEACSVSLNVISVGHAMILVTSWNGSGVAMEQYVLQNLGGPINGLGNVDNVVFTTPGIAWINMIFFVPHPGDGVGIDDLVINGGCTPVSVAPGSWSGLKARF